MVCIDTLIAFTHSFRENIWPFHHTPQKNDGYQLASLSFGHECVRFFFPNFGGFVHHFPMHGSSFSPRFDGFFPPNLFIVFPPFFPQDYCWGHTTPTSSKPPMVIPRSPSVPKTIASEVLPMATPSSEGLRQGCGDMEFAWCYFLVHLFFP